MTIEERYGCIGCNLASCEGCDSFLLVKGATEQQAIDEDHLREVKKMLIDKGWQWVIDWVFENAPHEVFDELMSSREDYIKEMEEQHGTY